NEASIAPTAKPCRRGGVCTRRIPERPSRRDAATAGTSRPIGEITPKPVMATRSRIEPPGRLRMPLSHPAATLGDTLRHGYWVACAGTLNVFTLSSFGPGRHRSPGADLAQARLFAHQGIDAGRIEQGTALLDQVGQRLVDAPGGLVGTG